MRNETAENSKWLFLLAVVVVLLAAGGALRAGLVRLPGQSAPVAKRVSVRVVNDAGPVSLGEFKNGFAAVLSPVLPAVVNISSTKIVKHQNAPEFFNDPLFRQFFG